MLNYTKIGILIFAIFGAFKKVKGTCDYDEVHRIVVVNCSMIHNPEYFTIRAQHYGDFYNQVSLIFNQSRITNLTKSTFEIEFPNQILKRLILINSHLSDFDKDIFPKLEHLDLTGNNLTNLGKSFKIPTLISLSVSRNFMEHLPDEIYQELSQLESLNVSYNAISQVSKNTFRKLKNLKELDLSGNRIRVFPPAVFGHLNKMNFLDLSKNALDKLDIDTFIGARSLRVLDVSGNKLKSMPSFVFQNTPELYQLNINNNEFKTLSPEALSELTYITDIEISGNNFQCEDLIEILKLFKRFSFNVAYGPEKEERSLHGIKCHGNP